MMDVVTLPEIQAATERLREIVVRTPLVPLHGFDGRTDIMLKLEIHQAVTSFKIRGVFNAVASLTPEARAKGLSTVSAGNTAQALAWTGRFFGVSSRSLMPDNAPTAKIEAVKNYSGEPVLVSTPEVFRFLKEHLWEKEPYTFIHPWTNRDVMIGHGTMAQEIVDDLPEIDTIFVPVGGGALIGGVGGAIKAIKPTVRVIGVEPKGCAALAESFKQGKAASVECKTICDGVAIPYMTDEVFSVLEKVVDDVVLVSDDKVKQVVRRLAHGNRIIVEPSAALSVAAAIATPLKARGCCACVVTGGSIDTDHLLGILAEA